MSGLKCYRVLTNPNPLYWVKDQDQIFIIDEHSQEIYRMHHLEALVWTWLTLAYSYSKIVELLTALLVISSAEAEQRLRIIFQTWKNAGILNVETH